MLALGRALACWLLERGVTADVCGVSLESRWLRCEPLAVGLFPLRLAGADGKVLSSLGALPTGASPDSRVSELPSPASGVLLGDGSLSSSIDDVIAEERHRGFGRYRSFALAFAGALVVAVLGIAISPKFERSRGLELEAKAAPGAATIRAALPGTLPATPTVASDAPVLPTSTLGSTAAATMLDTPDPTASAPLPSGSPLVVVGPPTDALDPAAKPRTSRRAEGTLPRAPRPAAPVPPPSSTVQGLDLLDPY
jgi:hypothetical protein